MAPLGTFCHNLFRNQYRVAYAAYMCTLALFGGVAIAVVDDLPYLDGLFVSTSAVTCTGLSTVSMLSLSTGSFATIAALTFFGGTIFVLIPPIIYRRHQYAKLRRKLASDMMARRITFHTPGMEPVLAGVALYDTLDDALKLAWKVFFGYVAGFHVVGMWVLYGGLMIKPHNPELRDRGITVFADAAFSTVSAFGNAGFMIASDNAVYMRDNPFAYCWICVLILAGITLAPFLLRLAFVVLHRFAVATRQPALTARVQFILDNPRIITTQLFGRETTKYLTLMVVAINLVQVRWLCRFCVISLFRPVVFFC